MNAIRMIGALTLLPLALSCSSHQIAVRAKPAPANMVVPDGNALTQGRMLFERGEFALAADAFRKAVRQNPENADAYNGLAASYDNLGRYDLSRRYYELALARAPEDGRILRNLARSMLGQGDRLAARKLFAEAAALDGARETGAAAHPTPEPIQAAQAIVPEQAPYHSGQGTVTIALAPEPAQITIDLPAPEPVSPAPSSLFQRVAATILPPATALGNDVSVALDPPARAIPRKAVAIEKPAQLHIMNAVGRKRQAARMRSYLASSGWLGASIGDSRNKLLRSRILYRARDAAAARALANALPFKPRLQAARGAPALFLLLGRDAVAFDNQLRAPKQG